MRFTATELNSVLNYIAAHSCRGVLILSGYSAVAKETGLKAGRAAAAFYYLCGEGKILQEGNRVLLLDSAPFFEDIET